MKILSEIYIDLNPNDELILIKKNRFFAYLSKKYRERTIKKYCKQDFDFIICCRDTAKIISKYNLAKDCIIQLTSTGYDGVPLEQLNARNVKVMNVRNVYTVPIAEFVVYGVLSFFRRLRRNPNRTVPKLFRKYDLMREIYQKKVLILSFGNIGKSIAEKLSSFHAVVDAYDPYIESDGNATISKLYRTQEELADHLYQYDVIISTMPLVENTYNFCNVDFFSKCSDQLIFCNVGRRETVDNDYLYEILKGGKIQGAIMDEVELLPIKLCSRFRRLNNVLFYPGISTSTQEATIRLREQIIKNFYDYKDSSVLNNQIKNYEI